MGTLHARLSAPPGGSYTFAIERFADLYRFDFGTNAFAISPTTATHPLTVGSGAYLGLYVYDLLLPAVQFTDGDYGVYYTNVATGAVVDARSAVIMNGDTVSLTLNGIVGAILNAVAGNYIQANSIGAKIGAAGGVPALLPPNFVDLAVDATTGGVVVKTMPVGYSTTEWGAGLVHGAYTRDKLLALVGAMAVGKTTGIAPGSTDVKVFFPGDPITATAAIEYMLDPTNNRVTVITN